MQWATRISSSSQDMLQQALREEADYFPEPGSETPEPGTSAAVDEPTDGVSRDGCRFSLGTLAAAKAEGAYLDVSREAPAARSPLRQPASAPVDLLSMKGQG